MTDRIANRQNGFGILEVVVTLGMTLLIIAATVPLLLNSINALQLGIDAQNVASELQLAKFKAASQATPYQVAFSTTKGTSALQRYDSASSTFQDEGTALAMGSATSFLLNPPSVPSGAPSALSANIRFNTHGVPIDNSGTPTGNNGVYLGNGSSIMYAITVPLSGRIQVWWYDGSQWNLQ